MDLSPGTLKTPRNGLPPQTLSRIGVTVAIVTSACDGKVGAFGKFFGGVNVKPFASATLQLQGGFLNAFQRGDNLRYNCGRPDEGDIAFAWLSR
ncbi:MAG: hypothetical protein SLRJCFUN_001213 [Candidatus Fervidibacter sp.]